ncbi:MAG: winged helix DNA-binding domain-containing protein [Bacteroidales bacterium]
MKPSDISNIRLINQQIAAPEFKKVRDIANWMVAVQAQDFSMSKWALGIRLRNPTDKMIETAIDRGEILRTHLLRPTLHLVSAENIRWLLILTAPRIKARLKSRYKELELTESLFKKCNKIIRDSLKGGNHLTREEVVAILAKTKVHVEDQRGYHLLVRAELDGIICSGIIKGDKQTYALLDERVPGTKGLTKEEALKKIGLYFSSRGPATLQDFIWWSGLSATDAKNALEIVKPGLVSEKTGSEIYWFSNRHPYPENKDNSLHLLPAFDEFLLSYKDRLASIPSIYHRKTVSDNGIFRPIIVINGQVRGLWKRSVKKDKVIIEAELFEPVTRSIKDQLEKQIKSFGLFLDKKTETKLSIR